MHEARDRRYFGVRSGVAPSEVNHDKLLAVFRAVVRNAKVRSGRVALLGKATGCRGFSDVDHFAAQLAGEVKEGVARTREEGTAGAGTAAAVPRACGAFAVLRLPLRTRRRRGMSSRAPAQRRDCLAVRSCFGAVYSCYRQPSSVREEAEVSGEELARSSSRDGVITEPKDAQRRSGRQADRSTPLAGARVPCGPAMVSLERERWQVVTVDVNAEAGVAATVHERLRRPRGTIAFTSSPPGAQITINRVAAGTAPKQIDVQRYEKLQIKATLKGHAPWTKSVYLKDPEAAIDIQLSARK